MKNPEFGVESDQLYEKPSFSEKLGFYFFLFSLEFVTHLVYYLNGGDTGTTTQPRPVVIITPS